MIEFVRDCPLGKMGRGLAEDPKRDIQKEELEKTDNFHLFPSFSRSSSAKVSVESS